jgi:hypothetical protein
VAGEDVLTGLADEGDVAETVTKFAMLSERFSAKNWKMFVSASLKRMMSERPATSIVSSIDLPVLLKRKPALPVSVTPFKRAGRRAETKPATPQAPRPPPAS